MFEQTKTHIYSRRSLIRSHLDAQILDTDNFLWLIELTVIYSK